jgi:hypothetical protein
VRIRLQAAAKAGILLLFSQQFIWAQPPLRVEVLGTSHPNLAPITVRVTNLTAHSIDLPVPYNVQKNARENFKSPLPIDIEKFENGKWLPCRPLKMGGGTSRTVGPRKTREFTLGVLGAGRYRARVWYTIDRGNPPARRPASGSVVSQPFSVTPNPTT